MTKPRAGRASKFTPQIIQKIKEMVAQGLSREQIAQRLDVTVGSLQVTCSKLGVSLRRSRMRFPSYEPPKLELELSQAGSEVGLVEKGSLLKVKIAITIQRGDLLRTFDVPLTQQNSWRVGAPSIFATGKTRRVDSRNFDWSGRQRSSGKNAERRRHTA
jgi:hypothetical protein